ncbi:MAG: SH3 domain-containing protein [Gammaproteobacteria bacterium]
MSAANKPALAPGALVVAAILALGAEAAFAQTETRYVIEQVVVSVNATADGSGDRVEQIKSGDRVEVLEHQGEQSHVRLSSGQEGWVRTSYLSTTPPLRDQLKARTEELEKLRAEKTKLEADLAGAKKAASAAVAAAGTAPAVTPPPVAASEPAPRASDPPSAGSPATDTAPSNPPMFASDGMMPPRPSWLVAITVSVLTLIAGFVLGWRVLDKRIRAKYGGLRIY